jgi:uncharacterized protein YggU (UPF0235/DUF167 family)
VREPFAEYLGAYRDGLWRDGTGLLVHIRAIPADGAANRQLVDYVAGCLRVAKSLVSITHGHTGRHKTLEISLPEADVAPIIAALPLAPQSKLFDE